MNWIGVAALSESLSLLSEIGPRTVAKLARANAGAIAAGLADLPVTITSDSRPERRSQILAFSFGAPEADEAFVQYAYQNGVVLGRRGRGIRVGAHISGTTLRTSPGCSISSPRTELIPNDLASRS